MPDLTVAQILTAPIAGESTTATFTSVPSRARSAIRVPSRSGSGYAASTLAAIPASSATAPPTFDQARAAVEKAWQVFAANRTESDYQAWRDHRDWTAEKYRRFDRGEPMPRDWRAPHG